MHKVIIAIYTCEADQHLHEELYRSPVIKYLSALDNFELLEVYAKSDLNKSFLSGGKVYLATEESYQNLPEKTFEMISFIAEEFDFDHLVKLDVTSLTTAISSSRPTGGALLTNEEIIGKLADSDFYCDYNGYVKLFAKRRGVLNWALNKGISVDLNRVFEGEQIPPFYSGKMWCISKEFAAYIREDCADVLSLFKLYFPAEDVMLGTMHKNYELFSRADTGFN